MLKWIGLETRGVYCSRRERKREKGKGKMEEKRKKGKKKGKENNKKEKRQIEGMRGKGNEKGMGK